MRGFTNGVTSGQDHGPSGADADSGEFDAARPLLVTTDDAVSDDVLRLAAAVGCEIERAPDLTAARDSWARAPVVIIDEGTLRTAEQAHAGSPWRSGVLLASQGDPAAESWQRAFTAGVQRVVELPRDEAELVAILADVSEGSGTRSGAVLAVIGGTGGAGASVLAASAGMRAAHRGADALLVDCDPLGGGADVLLGAEHEGGLRWPGLRVRSGRVSMADLRAAVPSKAGGAGRLSILSCGRDVIDESSCPSDEAVASVIDAGRRAGNTVVVDLARHLDPASVAAARKADLLVLVVPAAVRASAAARRVLAGLSDVVEPGRLGVVVRGPAPEGVGTADVAEAVGAPLLAAMRPERGLDRALDRGEFTARPRGSLTAAADAVLAELEDRRATGRSR